MGIIVNISRSDYEFLTWSTPEYKKLISSLKRLDLFKGGYFKEFDHNDCDIISNEDYEFKFKKKMFNTLIIVVSLSNGLFKIPYRRDNDYSDSDSYYYHCDCDGALFVIKKRIRWEMRDEYAFDDGVI